MNQHPRMEQGTSSFNNVALSNDKKRNYITFDSAESLSSSRSMSCNDFSRTRRRMESSYQQARDDLR
jgi:hypothetical protein